MNLNDYLLMEVKPEEFSDLKRQEANLFSSMMEGFNDVWKPKVQGIKATFKYNLQRKAIGIYVERKGQQQLVIDEQGLSKEENVVVRNLYRTLKEGLDRVRLQREKWVDSVSS